MQNLLSTLGITTHMSGPAAIFSDAMLIDAGISQAEKARIKALRELVRLCGNAAPQEHKPVKKAEDVYRLMKDRLQHLQHEELHVVLLRSDNSVSGTAMLTKGSLNSTVIDTRQVAVEALKENAASVVLVHNHPSGSSLPSVSDIENTRKIKAALALFDVSLLDHIIISAEEYYSFAEERTFKTTRKCR